MSDTTANNVRDIPTVDPTAVILDRVHKRAFIEKIAQIAPAFLPKNDQQFEELLMLGDELQASAAYEEQTKAAAASPFAGPLAALRDVSAEAGMAPSVKQANDARRYLAIGAELAKDPEIFDAALTLKVAQLEAMDGQE